MVTFFYRAKDVHWKFRAENDINNEMQSYLQEHWQHGADLYFYYDEEL